MPNIKGKKFPYTKEGIKASKEYEESDARNRSQNYQFGGRVTEGIPGTPPPNPMGSGWGFGSIKPPAPPPETYKKGGKVKKGYKK
jgi:hypothetical protein